ncbi:MAG: DUF4231 domain-containing protein [Anaerolineae bacterium]|nr:DUF4231 domain-containing protein [Anaerolineae bacterium]
MSTPAESGAPAARANPPLVEPISQGSHPPAKLTDTGWIWWKQRPRRDFPAEPDPTFTLVGDALIQELTAKFSLDAEAIARIKTDIAHLEAELLRYFRETDHNAKKFQNGFRLYNWRLLMLATAATLVGSLQAISLSISPAMLLVLGALETIIALYTVYVVNARGRDASVEDWLKNRRMSEQLRREFFRYLMMLPPYNQDEKDFERKRKLSHRAAMIYADQIPDEPSILEGRAS